MYWKVNIKITKTGSFPSLQTADMKVLLKVSHTDLSTFNLFKLFSEISDKVVSICYAVSLVYKF